MSCHTLQWMKIGALLIVVLVGAPLLGAVTAAQDDDGAILRVHQSLYPETADPQQSSFSTEIAFLIQNYEGLTRLDSDLNVSPAAAEGWEFNEDGTVLTFHLRPGLTYSDGSPLTAERFVDAARRTCDPTVAGGYQYILFDIVGCEAFASLYAEGEGATPIAEGDTTAFEAARANVGVTALDERTVEVRLNHPAPYFPAVAGLWVFFPAKRELIEQGSADWWQDPALQIGNGPFQVTRMEADQLIAFAPNERYWAGRPALDGLEYVYVPDSAVAVEAYRTGDLDIVQPDWSQLPELRDDPRLSAELLSFPAASTSMFAFNLEQEPFTDKKVREAFAFGFDRDTFCNVVLSGDCVPTLSWVPPGIPGAIETDQYAFDPARARQALADSSYGGPENLPEITYVYVSDDPAEQGRAEWIAGQYRDILGVELTLAPMEGQTWVSMITDSTNTFPQLTGVGWINDYPDPQNWLSVVWNCQGFYSQVMGYCNETFDELTARGDAALDLEERVPLYEEAGRVLIGDVPAIFTFNDANTFLVKPEVQGYSVTAMDVEWPGMWVSPLTITVDGATAEDQAATAVASPTS